MEREDAASATNATLCVAHAWGTQVLGDDVQEWEEGTHVQIAATARGHHSDWGPIEEGIFHVLSRRRAHTARPAYPL